MDNIPIVLGQYKISKTLGMGAFGKVKRKITSACFAQTIFKKFHAMRSLDLSCSRASYHHRIESRCEDSQQGQNQAHGDGRESSP